MKVFFIVLLGIVTVQADPSLLDKYNKGNLKFSANVYRELAKTNSANFMFSPMSVETVFAILQTGAKAHTANEIAQGFHFPHNEEKLKALYKELSPKLQHTGDYNLSSANKLYINNEFKIKDDFMQDVTTVFNAEVQKINFAEKKVAVDEINQWVEEKTYNKIKEILSTDDVDALTKMVLVNAMYFKGNWLHEFYEAYTKKTTFYLNNKDTTDVDMMELTDSFNYHECEDTKAKYLEMNFLNSDVTMTIILPNENEGLAHLEEHLEKVFERPKFSSERVHLRLPKFEMGSTIQFKPILEKLGVVSVFDYGSADLTGINDDPKLKLAVDKVIQKTFIKVEEKGTTAAAATALLIKGISMPFLPPAPPKEFCADHPFIYVLRNAHGIMFAGRLVTNKNEP